MPKSGTRRYIIPTQLNLMGTGCPALQAQASVGIAVTGQSGAGTNQGTATVIPSDFNVFTTVALNTGAILPACGATGNRYMLADTIVVVNHGANPLLVYPPVGGSISTLAANASFSVPVGKIATFTVVGANAYGGGAA